MSSWKTGGDLGIDLGTSSVLVYVRGKGIVLNEPSLVAVDRDTNKILAVGGEAREMIGKTPGNIVAIRPLKDGVISDYNMTEKMLKEYIKRSYGKIKMVAPKVVLCIPSQATELEQRAVIQAAKTSGAKEVHLIEEPLAAAIGSGLNVGKANGYMIVDIGGGTTDIAVISLDGVVVRKSIKVAGDKFNEYIVKYVKEKYNIIIGERAAEDLKVNIGTVINDRDRNTSSVIKGRNLDTGLPVEVVVSSKEIAQALEHCVREIIIAVRQVLYMTPPELAADIFTNGIIMTGGGALLHGLDKRLKDSTKLSVNISNEPIKAVVEGIGKVLGDLDMMQNTTFEVGVSIVE